ncbi:hypothetical protein OO7_13559 [Providencia sneebia DSM 19967]|uniref:Uncharacterized protein n=1 Tax=Providencia sneebia DSM 19967 TaxID=1141660 RepID=K8W633_9GAMM|nr:hypothetical protein [Providencia sneebia]EKT55999.1 hypothetical protein OO7_13559 [Providencia sneebia DSM 19967]
MFKHIELLMNELSEKISANARFVVVLTLAVTTTITTITMKSINIYFITAFVFISISLYSPEIYRFFMNKLK